MENKILMFLMLMVLAVALVQCSERKRRSVYLKGEVDYAGRVNAMHERKLRELAANFEEAMIKQRRGVFDCADLAQKCHAFKYCCDGLSCNKENIFEEGVCVPAL